jgi:hypothetical protein
MAASLSVYTSSFDIILICGLTNDYTLFSNYSFVYKVYRWISLTIHIHNVAKVYQNKIM